MELWSDGLMLRIKSDCWRAFLRSPNSRYSWRVVFPDNVCPVSPNTTALSRVNGARKKVAYYRVERAEYRRAAEETCHTVR
jgi:hypothetical protein